LCEMHFIQRYSRSFFLFTIIVGINLCTQICSLRSLFRYKRTVLHWSGTQVTTWGQAIQTAKAPSSFSKRCISGKSKSKGKVADRMTPKSSTLSILPWLIRPQMNALINGAETCSSTTVKSSAIK